MMHLSTEMMVWMFKAVFIMGTSCAFPTEKAIYPWTAGILELFIDLAMPQVCWCHGFGTFANVPNLSGTCPTSFHFTGAAATITILLGFRFSSISSLNLPRYFSIFLIFLIFLWKTCCSWDVILSLIVIGSCTIYNQRPSKTISTISTKNIQRP